MEDQNPLTPDPAAPTPEPAPARPKTRAVARKAKAKKARPAAAAKPRVRRVARFVVLFRHGLAEDRALAKPDAERGLTDEGHAKTRRAARGLEALLPEADTLLSSPLLRAMQSALWVSKAYGGKLKIQVTDALLPDADPKAIAALLATLEGRNVIVVGHEPHLTGALAHFVRAPGAMRAELKKAGAIGIQLDARGHGALEWMLSPKMLRRLG